MILDALNANLRRIKHINHVFAASARLVGSEEVGEEERGGKFIDIQQLKVGRQNEQGMCMCVCVCVCVCVFC